MSSRIRKFVTKKGIVFAALILGLGYYFFMPVSEEDPEPRFYFHLVADVEFDGEHIVYDEYVLCEATRYQVFGQVPNRRYRMSSITMGKRLERGGVLFLRTPKACGAPNRALNRHRKSDPAQRGSVQEIFDKIKLPEHIIPYFYWMDDDTHPTIMESYHSETYFEQPYARLKVNKVFIGDYRETLPEGVEIDDDLVKLPDPMSPTFLQEKAGQSGKPIEEVRGKYKSIGTQWRSYSLHPIFEEEWRTSPPYVEAIGHLTAKDDIVILPRSLYAEGGKQIVRDNLSTPARRALSSLSAKYAASSKRGVGLPRLSLFPVGSKKIVEYPGYKLNLISQGAGMSTARIPGLKRVDEVFSLRCDVTVCELKERLIGVQFSYRNTREPMENNKFGSNNLVRTIIYEGKEIPILNKNQTVFTVFYDPKTRIIWVFDSSHAY